MPETNCSATAGPLVSTAAETALLAKLLMKMPNNEQLMMPRTKTHVSVNHSNAVVGRRRLKTTTPTDSRMMASARLTMATNMIFPTKYDVAVVGVPRSRLSEPVSRSAAMLMPRLMNDVERIPYASMLAAITAPVLVSLLGSFIEKIEPNSRQISAGSENVSATCSGLR